MIRALALALALAAAPGIAADRIHVLTTSADLKSLVESVGGERVEVESLASPDQDPHSIEIKPAQLARARRAELLVRVGLDHEPWLSRLSIAKVPVLDASRDVRLLQTETPRLRAERRAHVHAYGNTHYWLDPQNARPITASILDALRNLSPADGALFQTNRESFLKRLDAKIETWQKSLNPFAGTKAVVDRKSVV